MSATTPERLSVGRTLKIGSFYIGSAFPDILTSAVWNRVLISRLDLISFARGEPASPAETIAALAD